MNINHNIIETILFIVHQQGITWQGKAELYEITEIIETQHAWMWNLQNWLFFCEAAHFSDCQWSYPNLIVLCLWNPTKHAQWSFFPGCCMVQATQKDSKVSRKGKNSERVPSYNVVILTNND